MSSASWGGGGSEGWGGKRDCPGDYSTFALSLRFQLYRGVGLNQLQCSRNILSLELIFASRKLRIQKHKRLKKKRTFQPLVPWVSPLTGHIVAVIQHLRKTTQREGFCFILFACYFFFVYCLFCFGFGLRFQRIQSIVLVSSEGEPHESRSRKGEGGREREGRLWERGEGEEGPGTRYNFQKHAPK